MDESSATGKALVEIYDGLGIALYDSDGQIRSLYDILYDLNKQWGSLDTNTKDYIALTQAGANQTQNFLALMSNFNTAIEATATAYNSAGSAARENARYMESLEARTQALKATFQDLANNVIDNELVSSLLNLANGALKLLNTDVGTFITQVGLLTGVLGGAISLAKYYIPVFTGLGVAAKGAAGGVAVLGTAIKAAFPIALVASAAIVGLVAAIGGIKEAYDKAHPSLEELESSIGDTVGAISTNEERLKSLNEIPWANRTPEIQAEIDKINEENEALREQLELLKQQKAEQLSESFIGRYGYSTYQYDFGDNSIVVRAQDASEALQEVSKQTGIAMQELSGFYLDELGAVEDLSILAAEAASGWFSSIGAVENYLRLGKEIPRQVVNEFFANREAAIALKTELQKLADAYGNNLNPKIASLINYLEDTIPLTADMASAFYDIDEITRRFTQGLSLQESEYQALITVHPQLKGCLTEQNGLWKLNAEAIVATGEASKEATRQILEDQKAQLEAQIQQIMALQTAVKSGGVAAMLFGEETTEELLNTDVLQLMKQVVKIEQSIQDLFGKPTDAGVDVQTYEDRLKQMAEANREYIDDLEHELLIYEHQEDATQEGRIAKMKEIQAVLSKQEEAFRRMGEAENSDYIQDLQKQWYQYADKIKAIYNDIVAEQERADQEYLDLLQGEIQSALDKTLAAIESAANAQIAYFENLIAQEEQLIERLEEQIDSFEKELDDIDGAVDYLIDNIDDRIAGLEDTLDAVNAKYDAQVEAIESVNSELDKQIALEKALDDLARAKSKKVMVYKDGRYQYIEDTQAVSDAQSTLAEIKQNQAKEEALKKIEEARRAEIEAIQAEIDKWEEYKNQWETVLTVWEDALSREQALLIFGTDFEKMTWENRITNLEDYKDRVISLHHQIASAQSQISQAEDRIEIYEGSINTIKKQAEIDAQVAQINAQAAANSAMWFVIDRTTEEGQAAVEKLHQANLQLMAQRDALTGGTTQYTSSGHYIETTPTGSIQQGFGGFEPYEGLTSTELRDALRNPTTDVVTNLFNTPLSSYASGTMSARGGMSLVGEDGPELRVLGEGDGIIPTNMTKNLWKWGMVAPADLIRHLPTSSNPTQTQVVQISNLNLPSVTDGNSFVKYMKDNFWRNTLQFALT